MVEGGSTPDPTKEAPASVVEPSSSQQYPSETFE